VMAKMKITDPAAFLAKLEDRKTNVRAWAEELGVTPKTIYNHGKRLREQPPTNENAPAT